MKKLTAIIALALGVFLLAGCSDITYAPVDPGVVTSSSGTGGKDDNGSPGGETTDRAVIKTADLYITNSDPSKTADQLVAIVGQQGGYVDQRSVSNGSDAANARVNLVVRVPAAKLDAALTQLKALGTVASLTVSASDVTLTVKDLQARIGALEVSVNRLLDLMKVAKSATDLIQIETTLSQRQTELESLKTQLSYYDDAVAMSTVNVTITSPQLAPQQYPSDFLQGLILGWNALVGFFSAVFVTIGVVIPWLIIVGAPITAVVYDLVLRRRKREAKAEANKTESKVTKK